MARGRRVQHREAQVKILGLDLGVVNPAAAIVHRGTPRYRVTWRANGHFPKPANERLTRAASLRARLKLALALYQQWLTHAKAEGVILAVIEDPRTTITGKGQRGVTNHATIGMQLEQFHRVTGYAEALGLRVVNVTPQEAGRMMSLSLPVFPGGDEKARRKHETVRRKAKKAQTKRFTELCLDGHDLLETEDETDAAAIAWVGGRKVR